MEMKQPETVTIFMDEAQDMPTERNETAGVRAQRKQVKPKLRIKATKRAMRADFIAAMKQTPASRSDIDYYIRYAEQSKFSARQAHEFYCETIRDWQGLSL